jgi:small subunit ribosomal protein S9
MNEIKIVTSGKRKRAVAKAVVTEGDGKVTINKKNIKQLHLFGRLRMEEPLRIAEGILGKIGFNVAITVRGGGEMGQIDAARIALARGIVEFTKSKEISKTFLAYDRNLLIADVRRKETRKPGDSKARAKRQTSYR